MTSVVNITVAISDDDRFATIRQSHRSTPIVADVLGVDMDAMRRPERVYLRSKIHGCESEIAYAGWQPTGAITTILTRIKKVAL